MNEQVILLVEDNEQDERLALRALRQAGVAERVVVVRDGQQALDYLFREGEFSGRGGPELPAVVLLDIGLPRLTGLEVLRRLRADERTRLQPVVMLTSSDDPADMQHCYRHGANSFVRKPLASAAYAQAVSRLGAYWTSINLPPQ